MINYVSSAICNVKEYDRERSMWLAENMAIATRLALRSRRRNLKRSTRGLWGRIWK